MKPYPWQRAALGLPPEHKTVNCVTPPRDESADTSLNGRQDRPPMEGKQMFRTDKIDYVVFFTLAFALVATLVR